MTRLDVLIASLLLIVASLSGCITEELVDDILGCMDENAANYEENATTELVGDCIYMATAETFMEAMTDVGSIEDILEDTPKAGYSQSISSSEWNQDLGMQMDVEIEDIVMADLNTDSVYVHNSISIAGLLQMEYTHVQVGEVVNIHLLMGGMMVQGDAIQSVSQTRDATPNVLEVIAEQAGLFSGEDDDGEDDGGDEVDERGHRLQEVEHRAHEPGNRVVASGPDARRHADDDRDRGGDQHEGQGVHRVVPLVDEHDEQQSEGGADGELPSLDPPRERGEDKDDHPEGRGDQHPVERLVDHAENHGDGVEERIV